MNRVINHFLREAYNLGETFSDDPSTKTCAIITDCSLRHVLAHGINQLTAGMESRKSEIVSERAVKYAYMEHAERGAIFQAAKRGISLDGSVMIAPWAACPDCARAIVLSGISKVYAHKEAYWRSPTRWHEAIEQGIDILESGGVEYILIDEVLGDCQNTFDEKVWMP